MKSVYWGDLCPRGQDMAREAFADFRQSMACFAVLWKDFGWVWGGQGGAVTLIQLRDDCGFRWVVTGTQRKPGLCWRGLDYSRKVCSVWPRPARNKELLFPWDGGGRGRSMLAVKNAPANEGDERDAGSIPGVRKILWSRKWQPIPIFLPGESHGQKSLAGYSPWGHKSQTRLSN